MKRVIIALALCACASAQNTSVRTSDRPAQEGNELLVYRDGGSNVEYLCYADSPNATSIFAVTASGSVQPNTTIAIANITSIVVSTNTATLTTTQAHGLRVGARITVSGATVDTDLNGAYTVATVGSGTTLTFTTASVANATYNEATLLVRTNAPRSNSKVWSIQRNFYTSTSFDRAVWAWGSPAAEFACDSRTAYFQ